MKGMFSKLTLVKKLVASTAIVLSIMLVFGISTVEKFSQVSNEQHVVVDEVQPALIAVEKLTDDVLNAGMSIGYYMLDKSESNLSNYGEKIASAEKRVQALLAQEHLLAQNPRMLPLLEDIVKQINKVKSYQPEIVNVATNTGANIIASQFATDTLNPVAIDISQILTEIILVEEDEEATVVRKQILADINNLRYIWTNMLNEMRLFLAFRTDSSKANVKLYQESVLDQIEKVLMWGDDLLFEQEDGMDQIKEKFEFYSANIPELIRIHESDRWRTDAWIVKTKLEPAIQLLQNDITELVDDLTDISHNVTKNVELIIEEGTSETIMTISVSMLIMCVLAWLLTATINSQLGADPTELLQITESIAQGDLESELDVRVPKGVYASVLAMQRNLRENINKERAVAAENGRIKNALDNVSTNVIIADESLDIIYINKSAQAMLRKHELAIKNDLPDFRANELVGKGIDAVHRGGNQFRESLTHLKDTLITNETVGGRIMRSTVNPIFSEEGERRGTVVEVLDRTDEVAIEGEIQDIVNGALAGDLGKRINLNDKKDFIERLSDGINKLVDVSDRAIGETVKVFSALSQGDLTKSIDGAYEGEYRRLKDDVNATIEKLTQVMCEINEGAQMVFDRSIEMAESNSSLSERTEKQAANLEETASSMLQMTSTVKNNANSANDASEIASSARNQAEAGSQVVSRAVAAMEEITESSNKIAAIIGVIDEIAFQTNLLALNAAVEAARAGEQGRGFAVVANEVRNLAGRSAVAAKEIKGLIEESVTKIEDGSKLVDDSGRTLEEIMGSVKKVSNIVADIATASQEQSEGIELVNRAITQMDEMTQQNAAMVEQAAASSESMGGQAKVLNELVGFFTINGQSEPKPKKAVYQGVERRVASRPWAEKETGVHTNTTPVKVKAANVDIQASQSTADGWDEF